MLTLQFILAVGSFCYAMAQQRGVQTIQLRHSHTPPELTLAHGQRFHLFLSHTWNTGQDAVATIKRQLQLLLPEVVIFLEYSLLRFEPRLVLRVQPIDQRSDYGRIPVRTASMISTTLQILSATLKQAR